MNGISIEKPLLELGQLILLLARDDEDGGLSTIAENATTLLEDARNVEDLNMVTAKCKLEPTTPQTGNTAVAALTVPTAVLLAAVVPKVQNTVTTFTSVFADAQDQRNKKAVEHIKFEAEWRRDKLQLKNQIESESILLKRTELEEASKEHALEHELKEK
ncbi:hypothetical protein HK100_002093 [Physocladia obscura]|uniref:Uncharacterized protein n=1 Tax=Physocladia obscura TaxID=109957 RepID=A0AAD5XE28_9FUNG|nr:hypothetical protein HK100_002093 [Physocladia obscura]